MLCGFGIISYLQNFIFHSDPLVSSPMQYDSAKAAFRGVTLADPLWIAQPSDPIGRISAVGFIRSSMSGDHLNNKGRVCRSFGIFASGASAEVPGALVASED